MSDPQHFNPGSVDAVNQGCTCTFERNRLGRGLVEMPTVFLIAPECPLHWPLGPPEEEDDHA